MECFLCIESITKPVTCCGCQYTTCTPCAQKYLLSQPIGAHCMNPECNIKWTTKFLYILFTKNWVESIYRVHLKKISLEREQSKLPETLAQIPRYKKEQKQQEELKKLSILLQESKIRTRKIQSKISNLEFQNEYKTDTKSIPRFICPCPTDGCKGLIDSNFFCNLCETSICRRWRLLLNEEEKHECDEEVVATVKLLRGDTKSCPKCATPIYKIDGCDQMWCTQCQTPFSWKTGQIVEGIIHNPHAIRWQRENAHLIRDNRDIPCGGLIRMHTLSMLPRNEYNSLYPIHRRIAELPSEYGGLLILNTPNEDYEDLRKKLVLNQITEDQFKQKIFERDRRNARKEENHRILETLQTLTIERFRELAQKCREVESNNLAAATQLARYKTFVKKFKNDMEKIRKFINDAFQAELPFLGTPYPYIIPKNWGRITYRKPPTK